MIWSVTSKDEYEHYGITPVFKFYQEALGKENVKLAIIEEDDGLDFVLEDDVVLLRTASEPIIDTIRKKGIRSTAERFSLYERVRDKKTLAEFLASQGVVVPRQYSLSEVEDGKAYFVKPRFGSDSFGISQNSICHTKEQVAKQVSLLDAEFGKDVVIEDYIEGVDCTVSCITNGDEPLVAAMKVENDERGGIQTRKCKVEYDEYCSALTNASLKGAALNIFTLLGVESHARIDFRQNAEGQHYMIDVNLMPGLGPIDHLAKSFLLCKNMSYIDTLIAIVGTAKQK